MYWNVRIAETNQLVLSTLNRAKAHRVAMKIAQKGEATLVTVVGKTTKLVPFAVTTTASTIVKKFTSKVRSVVLSYGPILFWKEEVIGRFKTVFTVLNGMRIRVA